MHLKNVKKPMGIFSVYLVAIVMAFLGTMEAQANQASEVLLDKAKSRGFLFEVLNKASQKYYGLGLLENLNKKAFQGSLNEDKTLQIEKDLFTNKSELPDEGQDLISELFLLKEVQEVLMRNYFTEEKRKFLTEHLDLSKKHVLKGAIPHVTDLWNSRAYFSEEAKSFRLIWLKQKDLDRASKPTTINGKKTFVVEAYRDDFMGLPTDLAWILEQGPDFYTSYNASVERISENPNPAILVYPLYFARTEKNLGLFTVLAHEIGHALGFQADVRGPQASIYKVSTEEQDKIKEATFLPLFACMSQLPITELQSTYEGKLEEIRADLIAHWSLQSLIREQGLPVEATVQKAFESISAKYLTPDTDFDYSTDSHPSPDQRQRLFQGDCVLDQVPAFVVN